MANNLFISYDLIGPNRDYDAVHKAIKSLKVYAQVHESFWYVKSSKSAQEIFDIVFAACDDNDKVFVIDVTNKSAVWENLEDEIEDYIKAQWNALWW